MSDSQSAAHRADQFLKLRGHSRQKMLGNGKDGYVWSTTRLTAIKVHNYPESYLAERNAYMRFRDLGLSKISGFSIPIMYDFDDERFTFDMSIVTPPFIVDFASSRLDEPADTIEDPGNTFEDLLRERFGERADQVLALHYDLAEKTGVYLTDLHAHNIKF